MAAETPSPRMAGADIMQLLTLIETSRKPTPKINLKEVRPMHWEIPDDVGF